MIELASPQLNFMLRFWISSVKLLLWYFFCISFLFTSILWNVFSHNSGMSIFGCLPRPGSPCTVNFAPLRYLKLLRSNYWSSSQTLNTCWDVLGIAVMFCISSMAVILLITHMTCWACLYSIHNFSSSSRAGSWVDKRWPPILLALHVLHR